MWEKEKNPCSLNISNGLTITNSQIFSEEIRIFLADGDVSLKQ